MKLTNGDSVDADSPLGLVWDGDNYSCAYDALFTILLSIWSQDPLKLKTQFKDKNRIMNVLATGFYKATQNQGTLESSRNKVRHLLHLTCFLTAMQGHL